MLVPVWGCRNTAQKSGQTKINENTAIDSIFSKSKEKTHKRALKTQRNFKSLLNSLNNNIIHTGDKYSDELSNSSSNFVNEIFGLKEKELVANTTSYTYKSDCVFYVHNIKCVNDTLSIKPFLESAQGRATIGYLGERVLLFAMKNSKEANFIDIPEKSNPLELREELLNVLYKEINCDVILCHRTKNCVYKDLRKETSE